MDLHVQYRSLPLQKLSEHSTPWQNVKHMLRIILAYDAVLDSWSSLLSMIQFMESGVFHGGTPFMGVNIMRRLAFALLTATALTATPAAAFDLWSNGSLGAGLSFGGAGDISGAGGWAS